MISWGVNQLVLFLPFLPEPPCSDRATGELPLPSPQVPPLSTRSHIVHIFLGDDVDTQAFLWSDAKDSSNLMCFKIKGYLCLFRACNENLFPAVARHWEETWIWKHLRARQNVERKLFRFSSKPGPATDTLLIQGQKGRPFWNKFSLSQEIIKANCIKIVTPLIISLMFSQQWSTCQPLCHYHCITLIVNFAPADLSSTSEFKFFRTEVQRHGGHQLHIARLSSLSS